MLMTPSAPALTIHGWWGWKAMLVAPMPDLPCALLCPLSTFSGTIIGLRVRSLYLLCCVIIIVIIVIIVILLLCCKGDDGDKCGIMD